MYRVTMTEEIAGAHSLTLPYDSPCTRLHGHNWKVEVAVVADKLDEYGMVVDFCTLKRVVRELDHRCLNDIVKQPTAERIASYLAERINDELGTRAQVCAVRIVEAEGNVAEYFPPATMTRMFER
jgi:6-pyruvoyltetrahydropterin/6-carboxytetrahydropterin synthase